jgi:L-threonylcarbamoyladenylate synthase
MSCRIVSPTAAHLQEAAALLRAGELVGIPTETVYGLAGNALNDQAVAKIFDIKKRPQFNPLIIHGATLADLEPHVILSPHALLLAQAFWPGPLTLVLPRKKTSQISLLASAGLDTLAVRIPNHADCLALLKEVQLPLAAPSANPSQALSPTTAEHVKLGFKEEQRLPLILDGGAASVGLESTIVDLSDHRPTILRPGIITAEALSEVLGEDILTTSQSSDRPKAPGAMQRHYAPSLPLRLNVEAPSDGEALLAFGESGIKSSTPTLLNLSPTGNLVEAAANLFHMLRLLDQPSLKGIAVMPIPEVGIGRAINDRLRRAATAPVFG